MNPDSPAIMSYTGCTGYTRPGVLTGKKLLVSRISNTWVRVGLGLIVGSACSGRGIDSRTISTTKALAHEFRGQHEFRRRRNQQERLEVESLRLPVLPALMIRRRGRQDLEARGAARNALQRRQATSAASVRRERCICVANRGSAATDPARPHPAVSSAPRSGDIHCRARGSQRAIPRLLMLWPRAVSWEGTVLVRPTKRHLWRPVGTYPAVFFRAMAVTSWHRKTATPNSEVPCMSTQRRI